MTYQWPGLALRPCSQGGAYMVGLLLLFVFFHETPLFDLLT